MRVRDEPVVHQLGYFSAGSQRDRLGGAVVVADVIFMPRGRGVIARLGIGNSCGSIARLCPHG